MKGAAANSGHYKPAQMSFPVRLMAWSKQKGCPRCYAQEQTEKKEQHNKRLDAACKQKGYPAPRVRAGLLRRPRHDGANLI